MRHRLTESFSTGLGNPAKCLLDNKWSDNKILNEAANMIMYDAINEYFEEQGCYGGIDFGFAVSETGIYFSFGYEPAYKYGKLRIITLCTAKELSCIQEGIAFGFYGSGILQKIKYYKDYKYKSKFIRCIDKWHAELIEALKKSKELKDEAKEEFKKAYEEATGEKIVKIIA